VKKCHRKACTNTLPDAAHTATHRVTHDEYCIPCARYVNALSCEELIVWPALAQKRAQEQLANTYADLEESGLLPREDPRPVIEAGEDEPLIAHGAGPASPRRGSRGYCK
jgi:hypothetical protein